MCASKDQDAGAEAALEVLRRALAGRYLLRQEVGRGATAYVYLADDLKHDRPVAVKVLRRELVGRVGVERFLREIRLEARLQHPNIIPLYDSGEVDEVTYCVMPYVEGESLRSRLQRERQLAVPEALGIARDVASALAYAHSRGVVHRDVKPENILLSGDRALVADFGVARAIAAAGDDRLTDDGLAVGTPLYMSPEQASAGGVVDARSDVYALGCVVYEMLTGEPPFTGRTPQHVMLRHLHDPPVPLATLRPSVPPHVSQAVTTALAKVPADRFASALDFSRALESGTQTSGGAPAPPRSRRRWGWMLATGALVAAAGGMWWAARPEKPLDPNRIVVFPLRDGGRADGGASGADVATYIGHVLEGSDPLEWEEGRDLPEGNAGDLSAARASRIARSRGARFYVDGTVLREPDSIMVLLRLFDVAGDSMVTRAGRSGEPGTSAARLGALAVADLLPRLLEPGREVDVGGLRERRPGAITAFLQGERAYRRMRFPEALELYRRAVEDDTLFALAAVKGAQAASWLERHDEAEALTGVAERQIRLLPARYAEFVRGWRHFLGGRADSAEVHLRRVVALAPAWSEGWMALGEVYYHLLPERGPLDSLATAAFSEAQRLDEGFTPARYHAIELALVRGDLATARRLSSDLFRTPRDSTSSAALLLMLRCARGNLDAAGWRTAAGSNPAAVMEAAATLLSAPALQTCAERALRSVLAGDSVPDRYRANALFGLHALELSRGHGEEAARLAATPDGKAYHLDWLFLLEAAAGLAFSERAADLARAHGSEFDSMPSPLLWARGTWEARRGSRSAADAIAAILEARADTGDRRRDRLFADAVRAQALLARGDTSAGRAGLAAMKPSAGVQEIAWSLWEPLGIERLTLAEIALARGEHGEALRLASLLDAPAPFVYLIFRPVSLQIRLQAARGLKREDLVQAYEARMSAMGYRVEPNSEDRTLELN
ncbi:MAG TPA: serine/threonine-protein kinase [Gemmatimonadales bacterium]|nr:serine/threonine-protein kinase [Gemmatimonadales bacterium]